MTVVRQWTAPGGINLLGDHLDYYGGPVLSIAVDRQLSLKARLRDDDAVRVWTTMGGSQAVEFTLTTQPGEVADWAAPIAGVIRALAERGHHVHGADLVMGGDLTAGAGLSSSAAMKSVLVYALNDLLELKLDRRTLAALAGGAAAHHVALNGVAGQATLVDTSKEPITVEAVDADWAAAGLSLVVIDTNTGRQSAGDQLAERKEECCRAADVLDLERLCAAGPDAVLKLDNELLKARTRHAITETARVRGAVRALRTGNWTQFGSMLTASHASLRDDFAVSRMELDIAVESALEAGALGARMNGAGFAGNAIALIGTEDLSTLATRINSRFTFHEFAAPTLFKVTSADGVREITP